MTDDATINGSAVIESLRRDCDLPAAVPDEVIQTAIHEAGHAVTAWALGMPVRTLFILLDGTGGQCMSGDTGHSYFDPARLRSEMVFVAAGTEAQSLLGASSGQCFRRTPAGSLCTGIAWPFQPKRHVGTDLRFTTAGPCDRD